LDIDLKGNNRNAKLFVIIGIIVAGIAILGGTHYFTGNEVKVVQSKHENGIDKEVWVFKKSILGMKKKVLEITYFSDGSKESERNYKHGKVNGWARMWYKSGQLQVEGIYKNNKPHGVRTAYHENGQPYCRAKYKHGKLLGKKNWDENGKEIYLPLDRE
jgi:hypothetical protein